MLLFGLRRYAAFTSTRIRDLQFDKRVLRETISGSRLGLIFFRFIAAELFTTDEEHPNIRRMRFEGFWLLDHDNSRWYLYDLDLVRSPIIDHAALFGCDLPLPSGNRG